MTLTGKAGRGDVRLWEALHGSYTNILMRPAYMWFTVEYLRCIHLPRYSISISDLNYEDDICFKKWCLPLSVFLGGT